MTSDPRKYIIFITIATILAAFSFVSILVNTSPENSGRLLIGFLFLSIFLCSTGIFTLLGLLFRKVWKHRGIFSSNLSSSFRQGLFLSLFLIICVILSAHGLLYWWVVISVFLPFASLEAFLNLKI